MLDKTVGALLDAALETPEGCERALGKLQRVVLPWSTDGSTPLKLVRRTGTGTVVGTVDPWCGGYQNPRQPDVVGWRVRVPITGGTTGGSGAVTVPNPKDPDVVAAAMEHAQELVDEQLAQLCAERGMVLL